MIFRRRKADQSASDVEEPQDELAELDADRPNGPWDRSETSADADGSYIDLGGLLVKGGPGVELRLQVDEQTSAVVAVLLAAAESGVELRAFAAPRSGGIWDDVRADISAEAVRHGGQVSELDGEFGTELKVVVPVQLPNGQAGHQASRIVGVEGPRWLLRGTFLGKSVDNPDPAGVVETAFRDVIVVRGDEAMRPREMLPMQVPQQVEAAVPEPAADESGED